MLVEYKKTFKGSDCCLFMSSEADRFFGMAFGVARSYPLLFGTDRSEVVDGIDSGLYFKDKRDKTLGRSYLGVSIEVPFKVARLSLETISPSRDKIDVLVAGRDDIAERNHGALWYVSEGFQMEYGNIFEVICLFGNIHIIKLYRKYQQ